MSETETPATPAEHVLKMMERHGGPFHPVTVDIGPDGKVSHDGVKLRDWFAGMAIAGMTMRAPTSHSEETNIPKVAAIRAYAIADALLRAREGD